MAHQEERSQARRAKLEAVRADQERGRARKRNVTVTVAAIGAFAVVVAAALVTTKLTSADSEQEAAAQVVRPDSHRLQSAPGGKVTLVEFLDFECEACGQAFPVIERLRAQYTGKVTFVARYFPIASHFNAERAARAVEAAAKQGKFEAMYRQLYQNQKQWAEQRTPADGLFRAFAQGLGLDMKAWERAYNDPATLTRIKKDLADGKALGVEGTPTFFLNGKKLQPKSTDDIKAAIDAALAS